MAERKSGGVATLRTRLAQLIWLAAVVCALFLAVGALLIALDANQDNALVEFVLDVADVVDLDVFSRDNGIFTFDGAGRRDQERAGQLGPRRGRLPRRRPDPGADRPALTRDSGAVTNPTLGRVSARRTRR